MDDKPISSKTGDAAPQKRRLSRQAPEFLPMAPKPPKQPSAFSKKPPMNMKQISNIYMQQLGLISAALTEENKYVFKNQFLRLEEYSNLESVRRCFDPLEFVNEPNLKAEELYQSRAVVIRSKTYDDIHKAMKYGVWTSTSDKNVKLDEIYKECVANKQRLLLFFRVVKDNLFCGVAEMISPYIEEQKFNLWWENQRYRGIFNIRWIYVKNLPLMGVSLRENNMMVRDLKDGDCLGDQNKVTLLEGIRRMPYSFKNSVFKFFRKFDEREDQLISNRTVLDFEFKLQKTERKERGRRRKCSLIEGRSFKKDDQKKTENEDSRKEEETQEGEGKPDKEGTGKEEKPKDLVKEKRKKKKKRKKKRNDDYDPNYREDRPSKRGRKRKYDEEYYDNYYYDDRSYDDDYYGDYYYDDDYYYSRKRDRHYDDFDYEDDRYRKDRGYVRKDEAEKEKKKKPEGQKKRRRNRKKKPKPAQKEGEEKPDESQKPKKKKETKKKYVMVKESVQKKEEKVSETLIVSKLE